MAYNLQHYLYMWEEIVTFCPKCAQAVMKRDETKHEIEMESGDGKWKWELTISCDLSVARAKELCALSGLHVRRKKSAFWVCSPLRIQSVLGLHGCEKQSVFCVY